jgi:hypothetical protein
MPDLQITMSASFAATAKRSGISELLAKMADKATSILGALGNRVRRFTD